VELERFSELEQKIKRILEEYSTLKDRNRELEKLLEGKSTELEEMKSRVRVLNKEKDAVRTGVDMLLDMLHDIEVP
jgi:archaellum component FlaC